MTCSKISIPLPPPRYKAVVTPVLTVEFQQFNVCFPSRFLPSPPSLSEFFFGTFAPT